MGCAGSKKSDYERMEKNARNTLLRSSVKKQFELEKRGQSQNREEIIDEALPGVGVEARLGRRHGFTDEALPGDRVEARPGRSREGQFEQGDRGTVLEGGFEDQVAIVLDKTKNRIAIPRNRFFDWFQFLDKQCRYNVVLAAKVSRPSTKQIRVCCTSVAGEHVESWSCKKDVTLMTLRNHIESTKFVTKICQKIGMEKATARFMFYDGTPVRKMFRIADYERLLVIIEFQSKIEDWTQWWDPLSEP